jgi:PPOX class probable F420-dependent enzyme
VTRDEIAAYLREPHIADLATLRPNGSPHIAPVWYHHDGDKVMVVAERTAVKVRNIRHDPRVSLSIATDAAPYKYVLVTGDATISDAGIADLVRAMAVRYKGEADGQRYVDQVLEDLDFCVITVTPSKISGWGDES